jgi:hypothetical protein
VPHSIGEHLPAEPHDTDSTSARSHSDDCYRIHLRCQRPAIARVAGEDAHPLAEPAGCRRDDRVDGIGPARPSGQLPRGSAQLRGDRPLNNAFQQTVHAGIARAAAQRLVARFR